MHLRHLRDLNFETVGHTTIQRYTIKSNACYGLLIQDLTHAVKLTMIFKLNEIFKNRRMDTKEKIIAK